jgi:transposase InsO family protein
MARQMPQPPAGALSAVFAMNARTSTEHLFGSLKQARQIIEAWRLDYNARRPHTSLDGLNPTEFAARPTKGHNQNRLYL